MLLVATKLCLKFHVFANLNSLAMLSSAGEASSGGAGGGLDGASKPQADDYEGKLAIAAKSLFTETLW